jgi:hypothetical protein
MYAAVWWFLPSVFATDELTLCVTSLQGASNFMWAHEAAKWGADFMARSVQQDRVLLHIGDIKKDHSYLGRAENYPQQFSLLRHRCSQ